MDSGPGLPQWIQCEWPESNAFRTCIGLLTITWTVRARTGRRSAMRPNCEVIPHLRQNKMRNGKYSPNVIQCSAASNLTVPPTKAKKVRIESVKHLGWMLHASMKSASKTTVPCRIKNQVASPLRHIDHTSPVDVATGLGIGLILAPSLRRNLRDNVVADYQNGVEPRALDLSMEREWPIEDINGFVPLNPWKSKWAPNLDRALLNEPPVLGI